MIKTEQSTPQATSQPIKTRVKALSLASVLLVSGAVLAPTPLLSIALASDVRTSHTITAAKVTLGDLFNGLDAQDAGKFVTRAPSPGGSLRFTASQLDQIALQHGIALTLPMDFAGMTLTRAEDGSKQRARPSSVILLPVRLKAQPRVTGGTILLGDVLTGYFDGRRHKIAEAGLPGSDTILPITAIAEIAERYGLRVLAHNADATDEKSALPETIVVKRIGTVLPKETITAMISNELESANDLRGALIELLDYDTPQHIPVENTTDDVYVAAIKTNSNRDRFEATLLLPAEGSVPRPLKIKGSLAFPNDALMTAALSGAESGELSQAEPISTPVAPEKETVKEESTQPTAASTQTTEREKLQQQIREERAKKAADYRRMQQDIAERRTQILQDRLTGTPARVSETKQKSAKTPIAPVEQATVIEGVIRAGDLFKDAPEDLVDTKLMDAPAPGKSKYVTLYSLKRIMGQLGYRIDAPMHLKRIHVQREGMRLTDQDMRDVLDPHIKSEGLGGDYEVSFTGRKRTIYMPLDAEISDIEVDRFNLRRETLSFRAFLHIPTGSSEPLKVALNGRIEAMVKAPTLSQAVRPGQLISSSMINWARVPERSARNAITTEADLVGKTVTRPLSTGEVLDFTNVERPRIVLKKASVSMVYKVRGLTIQTLGVAQQDGAMGDTIQVMNLQSKTMVDARITGPGTVEPLILTLAQNRDTLGR